MIIFHSNPSLLLNVLYQKLKQPICCLLLTFFSFLPTSIAAQFIASNETSPTTTTAIAPPPLTTNLTTAALIPFVVWANEAIVATYTYSYSNFMQRQREIAKYYTAEGWIAYSQALTSSKLPEVIKKNAYTLSAVAAMPPELKEIAATQWEATMPLIVLYKGDGNTQTQNLLVKLNFIKAENGQGVRGLAIVSLQSKVIGPACQCQSVNDIIESSKQNESNTKPNSNHSP